MPFEPCEKCYSLHVGYDCSAWIDEISVGKESPEFTVSGTELLSSTKTYDYYYAQCQLQTHPNPELAGRWYSTPQGGCCGTENTPWYYFCVSMPYGEADTYTCTYKATGATFANVTLTPGLAWTGAPFTLHITSNDPRIIFSPSSVNITTGFNSPIVLTLTLNPAFAGNLVPTASVFSNGEGNCVEPTDAEWGFITTPILTCS